MHISDGVFIMSIGSELYSPSPCSVLSPARGRGGKTRRGVKRTRTAAGNSVRG